MLRLGKPNKKLISTNTGPGFPGFRIIGQKGPNYAGFRFLVSWLTKTGWNLAWKNFSKFLLTKKPNNTSMMVVLVFNWKDKGNGTMKKRNGFERVENGVWTKTLNGKRVDIYRSKTRSLFGCRWETYFLEIDDNHALQCGQHNGRFTHFSDSFSDSLRVGNDFLGR